MTPKEKSNELVKKFTLYLGTDVEGEEYYTSELDAKRCAIIAVDEIIEVLELIDTSTTVALCYWYHEVKQEIEKL